MALIIHGEKESHEQRTGEVELNTDPGIKVPQNEIRRETREIRKHFQENKIQREKYEEHWGQ